LKYSETFKDVDIVRKHGLIEDKDIKKYQVSTVSFDIGFILSVLQLAIKD